jgi:hypothetical protein
VAKKPHEELQRLAKLYAKYKMKWFVGNENLPYEFMKEKGGIWIYNARRDGFYHIPEVENLATGLDHVLDGGAKWTSRKDLVKSDDL